MSSNELQALFANLKPKLRDSPTPASNINRSTSVASNSHFSNPMPLPSSPPPLFPSGPNDSSYNSFPAGPASGPGATAQSLLSLLNFGPTPSSNTLPALDAVRNGQEIGSEGRSPPTFVAQAPPVPASDLLSKFMNATPAEGRGVARSPANLEDQGGGGTQTGSNLSPDVSQDALLKLLNRAHTTSSALSRHGSIERVRPDPTEDKGSHRLGDSTAGNSDLASRAVDLQNSGISTPSEVSKVDGKAAEQAQPIFTYTNPFEALHASRTQTPQARTPLSGLDPDVPQPSVETANDDLWTGEPARIATHEQVARRKILTPRLSSGPRATTFSREASASSPIPVQEPFTKEADIGLRSFQDETAPSKDDQEIISSQASVEPGVVEKAMQSAKDQVEGVDDWEDTVEAEISPSTDPSPRVVLVYNFPIKPFVSITLQLPSRAEAGIRDGGIMEISRLKKEFDQLDRSLATATSRYITYALAKSGMRVIRQDDGSDRQVFKHSHDRIFNVAFCSGIVSEDQAILGTGVSGSVYYAALLKDGHDLFDKNELDHGSLIFPPYPAADENTAGGVLKTRAKRSSHHPEFFAIGRGKAIHLVWPATALTSRYGISPENRRVDVDTFFQERSLQISTGKAGKDFTFSEDDSLIVSLDKTGRLRFWDIRKLIDESNATGARASMTVDMPLLSLSTASPAEKSWPTSVLFVDKARPYTRGGPLRYVLVGLRQNHTLQLWDIALGKAVQELNFPHENETDGICSVSYHPNSGIIVVGHPTRNSIFFIHLSAPRHSLSASLSQAAFVNRIAMKDPELPKPESTACMSGIREISFNEKGQLRSVELLPIKHPSELYKTLDEKTPLFELYVVHSRGVTCLNITKEDLGWNADNKVVHGIDANQEGLVNLKELRLGSVIEEAPRSKSPIEESQPPSRTAFKKKSTKKVSTSTERGDFAPPESAEIAKPPSIQPLTNGTARIGDAVNGEPQPIPKESKKSKKKAAAAAVADFTDPSKATPRTPSPTKNVQPAADVSTTKDLSSEDKSAIPSVGDVSSTGASDTTGKAEAVTVGISGDWLDKELKKVERGVSIEVRKELSTLFQSIQNDRLVQDAAASTRQEALLRLVSTTLTNNTEKSLSRIMAAQMQQVVVPAITGVTVQAVSNQVGDAVAKALHSFIPRELGVQLPMAINNTLQSPQVTRVIADTVSEKVSTHIENQLAEVLQKEVIPSFKDLALSAAEKAASEVEAKLRIEIRQFETQRRHDTERLEKLSQVLQGMAQTMQQMSDTQVAFQSQILKDRRHIALLGEGSQVSGSHQVSTIRMTPSPLQPAIPTKQKPKSKEILELEEITRLMDEGHYEEGSIKWLQSSQPVELFDNLFIQYTPEYLATDVSPLIAFSIAITIGSSLNTNTARRLEWIAAAFTAVDLSDPEMTDLAQHAPALLSSLIQKLEGMYMTIAERDPRNPVLQLMPGVSKKAKDMRASLLGPIAHGRGTGAPLF